MAYYLSSCIGNQKLRYGRAVTRVMRAEETRMERREWMGLMAKADAADLMRCWATAGLSPDYTELRPPEIGSVMVRGRMGGKGDAFTQYSDNSQRQYETGQQMKNSKKNRRHQTDERLAGQEFTTGEREAGEKHDNQNRRRTLRGQEKNIRLDDELTTGREKIAREGRQEDQKTQDVQVSES